MTHHSRLQHCVSANVASFCSSGRSPFVHYHTEGADSGACVWQVAFYDVAPCISGSITGLAWGVAVCRVPVSGVVPRTLPLPAAGDAIRNAELRRGRR